MTQEANVTETLESPESVEHHHEPETKEVATDDRVVEEPEVVTVSEEPVASSENTAEDQIKAAHEKTKEYYERMLRISAEFENYKKRSAREMDSFRKFANESILKDLLPVVDNLERAISSSAAAQGADQCITEGVDLTLKEILRVLARYGVNPVEAQGKPFDPGIHEAVMQQESEEVPENTVLTEFQRGYTLHERILRPAMVVVSKAKQA
ncbi:MAG: nucleotide exchange factor GrpE [Desulfobacteraceae bacterium IS3]|nr:MAG: nucleotide exchange factor GrpE [Desulfobacteraceae bacterium IS3]HAO19413.1 nucleotide exchange factor GrpE [Desulfobacteraceae bacterium]